MYIQLMVLYFLQTFRYYIFTRQCNFLFHILGLLSTSLVALIIGSLLVRTENKDIADKAYAKLISLNHQQFVDKLQIRLPLEIYIPDSEL